MINIVRRGKKAKHRIKCKHCDSILDFEDNDMWERSFLENCKLITCPVCDHEEIVIWNGDAMYKNVWVNY